MLLYSTDTCLMMVELCAKLTEHTAFPVTSLLHNTRHIWFHQLTVFNVSVKPQQCEIFCLH